MSLIFTENYGVEPRHDFPYKSFLDLPIYDQRYLTRWQTRQPAFYRIEDNDVLVKTEIRDLTYEGVCLYTNNDVRVNDRLTMKIILSPRCSFQAKGLVLWTNSSAQHSYSGVLFERLNEDVQGQILEHGFDEMLLERL